MVGYAFLRFLAMLLPADRRDLENLHYLNSAQ
jgi:hypothetical protein